VYRAIATSLEEKNLVSGMMRRAKFMCCFSIVCGFTILLLVVLYLQVDITRTPLASRESRRWSTQAKKVTIPGRIACMQ
jgi:hypothetical protein